MVTTLNVVVVVVVIVFVIIIEFLYNESHVKRKAFGKTYSREQNF